MGFSFRAISFVVLSFLCFNANSQTINESISKFSEKYLNEKLYLHYDKYVYSTGDTIWFKAYIMSGSMPSDKSKTFYVDWFDDKGNILQQSMYPIIESGAFGQLAIPENYKGSVIHVRAYSKWMLNFDSSFLYKNSIRILSKAKLTTSTIVPSLTLFPEGGNMISGIDNKIAFKANDQWGNPIKISGSIIDSKGNFIDSINIIHDGMGYFNLTPDASEKYFVKWKDEKKVIYSTELPNSKSEGASLKLLSKNEKRIFEINLSDKILSTMDSFHLVGTVYQQKVFTFSKAVNQKEPISRIAIPISDLPSGILVVTLFNNNWMPLAERITFINNNNYSFDTQMELQDLNLSKKARNEIKITIPENISANLSVSITDIGIITNKGNNIYSQFLLSGELKGHIYNPGYYFINKSDSVSEALDLVMLTHGWRKYNWDDMRLGKMPKIIYPVDSEYIHLSGNVYGLTSQQISTNRTLILFPKQNGKSIQPILATLNENGKFSLPNFIVYDTLELFYGVGNSKQTKDASLRLNSTGNVHTKFNLQNLNKYNSTADTAGLSMQMWLAKQSDNWAVKNSAKILETVILKIKTKSPLEKLDELYATGIFSGGDGYQFNLIDDPLASSSLNVFNYLTGKVAGLQISNGGGIGGSPNLQWRGGSPKLYLNEMPSESDMLNSITVSDIAYIKVFRPPFMGGFGGGNGAIAIYTRKGADVKKSIGKGLSSEKIFGYNSYKEFYSPNYSSGQANTDPDYRTTLYWNPIILLNPKSREMNIVFYNNDITKDYRVVIEGIDHDGLLTHFEQTTE